MNDHRKPAVFAFGVIATVLLLARCRIRLHGLQRHLHRDLGIAWIRIRQRRRQRRVDVLLHRSDAGNGEPGFCHGCLPSEGRTFQLRLQLDQTLAWPVHCDVDIGHLPHHWRRL